VYRGERFNSISHLVGASVAAAGLVLLVVVASLRGDPRQIVSFSVYGSTLLVLYLFSTLYHSLRGPAKNVFRKLDHGAIYILIAGTYTPFTLVTLRGGWGWSLFGVIWGLAALGIVLDLFGGRRRRILPVAVYVVMGWLVLLALKPLVRALPAGGLTLLLAGGLFYTSGLVFFLLGVRWPRAHGIWHLFVMGGSVSHYFAVLVYVG
jgi:hemolysin III